VRRIAIGRHPPNHSPNDSHLSFQPRENAEPNLRSSAMLVSLVLRFRNTVTYLDGLPIPIGKMRKSHHWAFRLLQGCPFLREEGQHEVTTLYRVRPPSPVALRIRVYDKGGRWARHLSPHLDPLLEGLEGEEEEIYVIVFLKHYT
jgi:hypothetical protein